MTVFFKYAPAPTAEQIREINQLKQAARDARARAEESFQRCDTDGFLSQWASNLGAQKDERQIRILENGGCAEFTVLCSGDSEVVTTRFRFFPVHLAQPWLGVKKVWDLGTELGEKIGRRWIPTGKNSRIQKQFGFHEEQRWFPAEAAITTGRSGGRGLSGAANAYVGIFRVDIPREWQY